MCCRYDLLYCHFKGIAHQIKENSNIFQFMNFQVNDHFNTLIQLFKLGNSSVLYCQ